MIIIIKGRVSVIIVLSQQALCKEYYDIDGTVLGTPFPRRLRAMLLRIFLGLPHRVQLVLERVFLPIKTRINFVLLPPKSRCFITARTSKTMRITIKELESKFGNISVVVFRRPCVKTADYYRKVGYDIFLAFGIIPKIVVRG